MLDSGLIFSDAQIITANATTVASDYADANSGTAGVVDLGALVEEYSEDAGTPTAKREFGPNDGRLVLCVSIGIAPTAGTGIYLDLEDCTTATGTFAPTGIGVDSANAIPIATLVAGYSILRVPLPPGLRRFLRILYTTTGDWTGSAGTFNSLLSWRTQSMNQTPYRA